jgi:hypothetical protein
MIHLAEKFQFERAIREYARWRAVDESERSPAAAWWWGPALAMSLAPDKLPAGWPELIGLQPGASYADGARLFLDALAEQTSLPWPDDFPRRYQATPADNTDKVSS